jgi:hypothetical protein
MQTDIPAGRIYKWFSGKGNPKSDDTIKLEKYLTKMEETPAELPISEPKNEEKDLSLKAITNLTETNHVLASNSSRLITLLEQANSNSAPRVPDISELIAPVIRMMAKAGVPDRWKSVDDGIVELGKLMVIGAQVSTV